MARSAADEREHRRGLVLGLTLSEVLLLLLFLLLLALAARLQRLEKRAAVAEAMSELSAAGESERREFAVWLETIVEADPIITGGLPDGRALADRLKRLRDLEGGLGQTHLSSDEIQKALSELLPFQKQVLEIVEAAKKGNPDDPVVSLKLAAEILSETPPATQLAEVREALLMVRQAKERTSQGLGDHRWPPIIALTEANGHSFKTGSAELSTELRGALSSGVIMRLRELIDQYKVDVIEVIGHTDEQRIAPRPSNLDAALFPYLRNAPDAEQLIPGDNAGLGLSRAVAVARVLAADKRLAGIRVMPLSGAQLIDTNDRLSTGTLAEDRQDRRRIELRVRRSQSAPEMPKAAR